MITITINTDNAAFEDDSRDAEVSRILLKLAAAITQYGLAEMAGLSLRDVNGNTVGSLEVADGPSSDLAATCVLTGAPGEDPDDCTTHAHE